MTSSTTKGCCIACRADELQIGTHWPTCALNGRCSCHTKCCEDIECKSQHIYSPKSAEDVVREFEKTWKGKMPSDLMLLTISRPDWEQMIAGQMGWLRTELSTLLTAIIGEIEAEMADPPDLFSPEECGAWNRATEKIRALIRQRLEV